MRPILERSIRTLGRSGIAALLVALLVGGAPCLGRSPAMFVPDSSWRGG